MMKYLRLLTVALAACLCGCVGSDSPQASAGTPSDPLPANYQQQIRARIAEVSGSAAPADYQFEKPRYGYLQDDPTGNGKRHYGWLITVRGSAGDYQPQASYLYMYIGGKLENVTETFSSRSGGYVP